MAHPPVGSRIEIPVHYDMWMRGARTGVVVSSHRSNRSGHANYVKVKLDHPQAHVQLKLWQPDWAYIKYL